MNIRNRTMAMAAIALASGFSGVAHAQDRDLKLHANFSYAQSSQKSMWNTVFIVSAAVFVVGLITEESTLTVLGGVGVVVSLIQNNKSGFRPQYSPRGINLINKGPVSFGVNPFGQMAYRNDFKSMSPSLYVVANFKF